MDNQGESNSGFSDRPSVMPGQATSMPEQSLEVTVQRVEQLKLFSRELQAMVYEELALIQDDVVRVRDIVADSIGILQTKIESIGTETNKHIEMANKVQLTQQSELQGLGSGKPYLCACDLEESKLPQTEAKNENGAIVNRVVNQVEPGLLTDVVGSHITGSDLADSQKQLQSDSMDVMRALQFEDIVSQVTERVAQQIGDIRLTVNTLSHLYDSEFSPTFDQDLEAMRGELAGIRKKLSASAAKNIVAQKNMDEGDIDLF